MSVPSRVCFFLGAQTSLHIRGFTWGGCFWSPRQAEVPAREGLTQESDRVPEASSMTPDARRGGPAPSSLCGLWSLSVCAASRLSCLMQQKACQSKENEFFARLVSRISLFLRASWREVLSLYGLGSGREKAMCRQKITLLGGADYLGWLSQSCAWSICSWVSTKMQTQWSLSCRETMLISVCLSPLLFNAGSLSNICLGDILYFHEILLKQPVSHKRTNMFFLKKKNIHSIAHKIMCAITYKKDWMSEKLFRFPGHTK